MPADTDFTIIPFGDHAVQINFGNSISAVTHASVMHAFHILKTHTQPFILDVIPGYCTLTIVYDIALLEEKDNKYNYITAYIYNELQSNTKIFGPGKRKLVIPVCYDILFGIDLQQMSGDKNISIDEIITIHTSATYTVYMLGFLPGFAYMGTVDARIATPRKQQPRRTVAAGSVGIASAQTGIYPFDSPGGWNIIGRTPLKIFDKENKSPCMFQAGDEVVFESIDINTYNHLLQQ